MQKMLESNLFSKGKRLPNLAIVKKCVLIGLFIFSLMPESISQSSKISITLKDATLVQVIKELEKQSDMGFVYDYNKAKKVNGINLNLKNVNIEKVLDEALKDSPLTYSINNNIVVLSEKKTAPSETKKDVEGLRTVTGKVVDETGVGLYGVTVLIQGTGNGVVTNEKGKYTVQVKPTDALRFSFIGYKTQIILINDQNEINIKLEPEVQEIGEVTIVAFGGEQKKESVVSSITTIKTADLETSNSDLTSSFTGKIAGMIGWQQGGMPGALTEDELNTKFFIRGITSFQTNANIDPLILLDGIEISKLDLSRIDPDDIESFNVMKDASATAMYGARGANGVIYIKTKKGKAGNVYTTFRYEKIWSMPTREIDVVNPIEYMQLYNEALTARNPLLLPKYTKERIQRTASGEYPEYVYPSTDWYDKLFKNLAINNHYSINVQGGSSKVQYYVSLTHNVDEGMIKTDKLNEFDCNITNNQTNFRTNLNIDLSKSAKLILNSFSTYDKYHGPYTSVQEAYYMAFQANPVDFAPTYPADDKYDWPHIRFGGSESSYNPYAEIQKGYTERKRFSTINKFEYIQKLGFWVKGLELRFSLNMSKNGYFSSAYRNIPALYALGSYDHETNTHTLIPLNEQFARKSLALDQWASGSHTQTTYGSQLMLMHAAAWKDHQTSFTAVLTTQEIDNNIPDNITASLPQRNLGFSARGTYGYKNKYFWEASFGYNGSERFAKKNKMGFFPAMGVAWVASSENFLLSATKWLTYLKFRLTYGKVGNDGIIKDPRFVYLQNIITEEYAGISKDPYPSYKFVILDYGNENIQWEVSEQANFGVDIKLFDGLIDITADIYQEIRHNIYAERTTIPTSIGLHQNPNDNVGKVRSRGFDFSGKIQYAFNEDLWFIFNSTFTFNKAVFLEIEEPANTPEWQKKEGREISQQIGYIAEGLFQDQREIINAPYQGGDVMPGDIRYRDINGDGIIDVNDAVPIGYPTTPRFNYGFNGFLHYKDFEFTFSFQGTGNRSFWINPSAISPFFGSRAVLRAIANDHWSVDNQTDFPFWPRLSTKNITEHNPQESLKDGEQQRLSTYFMRSGRFLRCRSIELAYYLKSEWLKKYKIKRCKFYVRANNPFIISDFNLWDVELGGNGFNYPIQKTYSFGVNLSF